MSWAVGEGRGRGRRSFDGVVGLLARLGGYCAGWLGVGRWVRMEPDASVENCYLEGEHHAVVRDRHPRRRVGVVLP